MTTQNSAPPAVVDDFMDKPDLPLLPAQASVEPPPPPYQRWAVKLEYDGTGLVGWQRQREGTSVQGLLERAATRMANGRAVTSITAGRTDAGVHATGQVAHLDFPAEMDLVPHRVRDGLSYYLKSHAVTVLEAAPVAQDWSARFSATWRAYRYRILNRQSRPALAASQVWHIRGQLDLDLMQEGANRLMGTHDFTSFRAVACQAHSPIRTMDTLRIEQHGEEVWVVAQARSFLHHQVRNIVGTLSLVGLKRWQPERITQALEARSRCAGGPTAPPDGLYLTGVGYDPDPFT